MNQPKHFFNLTRIDFRTIVKAPACNFATTICIVVADVVVVAVVDAVVSIQMVHGMGGSSRQSLTVRTSLVNSRGHLVRNVQIF